jgi:triphosphoribosyl-dephospho-CoA synthase
MMTGTTADAFIAACHDELESPKPGNVHVYAAGHRMTVAQFEASAVAAADPLSASGARVGARIRGAIEATVRAIGTNTNLGIVLLCAPLAAAADPASAPTKARLRSAGAANSSPLPHGERIGAGAVPEGAAVQPRTTPRPIPPPQGRRESPSTLPNPHLGRAQSGSFARDDEGTHRDLRQSLLHVLDGLDVADAADAFAAIVQASPAGLGRAERHDVFAPPQVTLRQAMAEAADRDRVARQYATGFADVFDLGIPVRATAAARWSDPKFATLAVYLGFLSRFPDSHIVRKHGAGTAAEVCRAARKFDALLRQSSNPDALMDELLAWDANLKARGLNPGTTADLTVATLFAVRLQSCLAVRAY